MFPDTARLLWLLFSVRAQAWEAAFADTGTPLLVPLFPSYPFPLFLDLFLSRRTVNVPRVVNSAIRSQWKAFEYNEFSRATPSSLEEI